MRKGIPVSVWGDEEGDPCICEWGMRKGVPLCGGMGKGVPVSVWGMRKGVTLSVWGDEEGGPCICVGG